MILAGIILLLASPVTSALEVPRIDHYVNDHAGLLTPAQRSTLEEILRGHEQKTTNQVVILTIPSLEGEPLEEFSLKAAHGRIGQKGRDNGALLLVAKKERKVRIEVGYGLEGALTDAESSGIIRQVIAPAFKSGDYYGGLFNGTRAILQAIEGEFKGSPAAKRPRASSRTGLLIGVFLLVVIPLAVLGFLPVPLRAGGGGLAGFLLGLILYGSLVAAIIAAVFGAIFLFFLSAAGAFGPRRRGGFWGGGFPGGGFSSGGFSGGGGGFGGGGASGSW
jgi:uncharacterized protein